MEQVRRFAKKYRRHLLRLWLEEWVEWMLRNLPGFGGILMRRIFYRLFFGSLGGGALIYPGGYFKHAYGLRTGQRLSTNAGVVIDARGEVSIGNDVMLGPHVVIASSFHDYRQTNEPMALRDNVFAPVKIGNDVWVGAHAFIRGGVLVGDGAVIGAGAVVVDNVEPYSIVGGNPAKRIGRRSEEEPSR